MAAGRWTWPPAAWPWALRARQRRRPAPSSAAGRRPNGTAQGRRRASEGRRTRRTAANGRRRQRMAASGRRVAVRTALRQRRAGAVRSSTSGSRRVGRRRRTRRPIGRGRGGPGGPAYFWLPGRSAGLFLGHARGCQRLASSRERCALLDGLANANETRVSVAVVVAVAAALRDAPRRAAPRPVSFFDGASPSRRWSLVAGIFVPYFGT